MNTLRWAIYTPHRCATDGYRVLDVLEGIAEPQALLRAAKLTAGTDMVTYLGPCSSRLAAKFRRDGGMIPTALDERETPPVLDLA